MKHVSVGIKMQDNFMIIIITVIKNILTKYTSTYKTTYYSLIYCILPH